MTETSDDRGAKSPQAPDDHYQPWLRNQDGPAASGPPVSRPQPLPTVATGVSGNDTGQAGESVFDSLATQQRQRAATMSADELLARPIPAPPPPGPGMAQQVGEVGRRIGGVLGTFADWTIAMGRRADVPARIARLEIGRRAGEAGATVTRLIGKGAAGTGDAAKAAIDAAGRAGEKAAPKIKAAASAARDGIAKGASAAGAGIGGAARKVAEATPLPGLGSKSEPVVESQLDRLIEAEAAAPRPTRPSPALPLFAEPASETPVPQESVAARPQAAASAAPLPPVSGPSASPAGTPYPAATPTNAEPRQGHSARSGGGSGGNGSGGNGGRPIGGGAPLSDWARHPATWVLAGLALLATGFAGGAWWTGMGGNRAATERTIHDYLLNNPAIIPQAMEKLQKDRQAEAVNRLRQRIERPFSGAWAGAADGDVTLTVFTDYACTFCRASVPDIDRLLREDRKLKVVFRELPILSRDSEPAARLALVAARRGQYMAMHRALFASGNPDSAARVDAAEELAVPADNAQLADSAITRELEGNVSLARELGFDGTPSWVVGSQLLTGAVGYDQLRAAVAAARAE